MDPSWIHFTEDSWVNSFNTHGILADAKGYTSFQALKKNYLKFDNLWVSEHC